MIECMFMHFHALCARTSTVFLKIICIDILQSKMDSGTLEIIHSLPVSAKV
jgi:hypothetical protein